MDLSVSTPIRCAARRMDALDWGARPALSIALFIVLPVMVGRANTPYLSGQPLQLTSDVRAEMDYLRQARAALKLLDEAHRDLALFQPNNGAEAFHAGAEIQKLAGQLEKQVDDLSNQTPPGRFSGLHKQLVETLKLYYTLTAEAWAYTGDMNTAHLDTLHNGLFEGDRRRVELARIVRALDFVIGPPDAAPGQGGPDEIDLPPVKL